MLTADQIDSLIRSDRAVAKRRRRYIRRHALSLSDLTFWCDLCMWDWFFNPVGNDHLQHPTHVDDVWWSGSPLDRRCYEEERQKVLDRSNHRQLLIDMDKAYSHPCECISCVYGFDSWYFDQELRLQPDRVLKVPIGWYDWKTGRHPLYY